MATAPPNVLAVRAGSGAAEAVSKTYGIDDWGFGYFHVNGKGNLSVAPWKDPQRAIDVHEVVLDLVRQNHSTPFLLRFPQILDERLEALHQAFRNAMAEFDYAGRHLAVYPVKVNQKVEVVRRLVDSGARYLYGLEVGSKAELIAALESLEA